jgi:NAD(P)-dependent dehydrogenase (short-subunit alcohol dehydrogenase family)
MDRPPRIDRRTALRAGVAAGLGGLATGLAATQPGAAAPARTAPAGRVLMVYFSRAGEQYWNGGRRTVAIGNTARIAGFINDFIHPAVYRLEPAEPYPASYKATVDRNTRELHDDARPAIAHPLPDLSAYRTILLGSPVWAVQEPRIMRTLLDGALSKGLAGRAVHPFVTYAVSHMGYAASKHAIIGLTRSAALDYATRKIRVNAVLPGNIETPMMDRFTGGDIQKAIDLEPVGRLGKPEEIAEAVLWMASDLGGFVTGAATVVDGGWSL